MKLLALDTSTPALSLAVVDTPGRVLAQRDLAPGVDQAVVLADLVADALREAGLALAQLDGIAVGVGPGAFTGLRVSLATAKGLAYAARLPLLGVSSLAALAHAAAQLAPQAAAIVPVLDARKGEVYAAAFDPAGRELAPEVVAPPDRAAALLRDLPRPLLLLGPGHALHRPLLDAAAGPDRLEPAGLPAAPPAASIAALAAPRVGAFSAAAVFSLEPRYLRSSDRDLSLGPPRPV